MALTTDRPAASHQPGIPGPMRQSVTGALPLLVASVAGLVAVGWVALRTSTGRRLDQRAMVVLARGGGFGGDRLIGLLGQVSAGWAAIAVAGMVVIALLRGRIRVALAGVVLVAGANMSTQLLKKVVLDRPELGLGNGGSAPNSLPSGHTTVAFSLALAGVLAVPHALRWLLVLLGSAAGALTGWTTVLAGWHRPSDVVAAMFVTLAWAALASGVVAGTPRHRAARGGDGLCLGVLGGLAVAAVMLVWGGGWTQHHQRAVLATVAAVAGVAAVGTGLYARLVSRASD